MQSFLFAIFEAVVVVLVVVGPRRHGGIDTLTTFLLRGRHEVNQLELDSYSYHFFCFYLLQL
jgi:hypothetical protein